MLSDGTSDPPGAGAHHRPSRDPWVRRAGIGMGVTAGVALAVMLALAVVGAPGALAAAGVLATFTLGSLVCALLVLIAALRDEAKVQRVSGRRIVLGVALAVAGGVFGALTLASLATAAA